MADGKIEVELELTDKKAKSQATKAGKEIGDAVKNGTKGADSALDGLKSKFGSTFTGAGKTAKDSLKGVSESAKDMGSSVESASEKGGNSLLEIAKKAAKAVIAFESIKKASEFIKSSLDAYATYEQLVGGVETLFGAGGQSIEQYAQSVGKSVDEISGKYDELMMAQDMVMKDAAEAYKTAGVSANTYMEQATSFSASLISSLEGDTVKAAEYANMAIVDMSDNANKMGTDIERIQDAYQGFAKQNYTMLDNLKLGYGGTKTEMERLIEDANELAAANGQAADLTIDSYADVIEAIHLVQENMGITGTTALEAEETIEGSLKMAKAAYENFLVGLGDDNANIQELTLELFSSLETAATNILPRISQIVSSVARTVANLLPEIGGEFAAQVSGMLSDVVVAIVAAMPGIIQGTVNMLQVLAVEILDAIPSILTGISEAFAEGIPSLVGGIMDSFTSLIKNLPRIIKGIVDAIPEIIDNIVTILTDSVDILIDGFIQLFEAVIEALPQIVQALINAAPRIITALVEGLLRSVTTLVQGFVKLFLALVDALPQIIQALVPMMPQIVIAIAVALLENLPVLLEAAIQLFTALLDGLLEIVPQVITTMAEMLAQIISDIGNWIGEMASKAIEAGSQFLNGIITTLQNLPYTVMSFLTQVIVNVATFVSEFAGKALEAGQQFLSNIVDTVSQIPARMVEIGGHIVSGIWEGISGAAGWLMDQIGGFAQGVIDGIAGFFGIASPSTIMRDFVGANIAEGIAVGFNENDPMPAIESTLSDGIDALAQTGTEAGSAFAESVGDQMGEAQSSGSLVADGANSGFMQGINDASNIGNNTAEAYIGEINKADASPAAGKLKDGAITELNKGEEEARNSGINLGQGFIDGMDSMLSNVIEKAKQMARAAIEAIKKEGQQGSPWKTTIEIGEYAGEGLAIGFERANPMRQIADTVRSGISAISSMAQQTSTYTTNNQTLNFNQPVQSPDQISRMLRMQQKYGLAGNF